MKERARDVVHKLRKEATHHKWRKSRKIRWLIGIVLTLAVAALFPRAHTANLTGLSVGSLWTNENVDAPFTYPVVKRAQRLRQDIALALDGLYPVYVPDTSALARTVDSLRISLDRIDSVLARGARNGSTALVDSVQTLPLAAEDWEALAGLVPKPLGGAKQSAGSRPHGDWSPRLGDYQSALSKAIASLYSAGSVASSLPPDDFSGSTDTVAVRTRANAEVLIPTDSLITLDAAQNRIFASLDGRLRQQAVVLNVLAKIARASLVPSVEYSSALTEASRAAIIDRVPRTLGIVVEGQRVISKGDVVTEDTRNSLESLAQARIDLGGPVGQAKRIVGTVGHAAIIILLIVLYLRFIRRRIYVDNAQLLLMGLVILFPAVLAFLSVHIHIRFPLEYLVLVPVTSMLLTILFDSRTGFYGTVVVSLIVAGIRGNDYSVALAGLTAGAFAAYTVRDLRSRGQLFQSIGYIFLGYSIAIIALAFEKSTPYADTGYALIAALANALVSPVLTFGVLYVVEMIFDTVSDLRLTEYDNINHPLLRELALRAPGTYQHTMLVAQLAENAAIAIGANALLAKVGAFFHDIGKLTEPTDFIENQAADGTNIHDALDPANSAERVRAHVTQGIELGRAHHLPEKIIDFIPMHHGTLRISFFYGKALEAAALAQPGASTEIDENVYRYPGPRPNTKETAIVMLADASEAIARTVASQTVEPPFDAIESGIEKLIRSRFVDGQLDLCDLTIRDLQVIRRVFARLLAGLHHGRIAYPTPQLVHVAEEETTEEILREGEAV